MQFELDRTYPQPLGYLDSPATIDLLTPDGQLLIGQARRTGLTPPGYPDHPVYCLPVRLADYYPLPVGFETRFYVFDGRSFFESETWRAAERARQQVRPLLITACAKAKIKTTGVIPAWQRYDGPVYRLIRKLKREKQGPPLTWFILSAEYGLIRPADLIPDYDRQMTLDRAGILRPVVSATLRPYLRAEAIFVHLGRTYRAALPEMPAHTRYAAGPPGQRLVQLRQWLAGCH